MEGEVKLERLYRWLRDNDITFGAFLNNKETHNDELLDIAIYVKFIWAISGVLKFHKEDCSIIYDSRFGRVYDGESSEYIDVDADSEIFCYTDLCQNPLVDFLMGYFNSSDNWEMTLCPVYLDTSILEDNPLEIEVVKKWNPTKDDEFPEKLLIEMPEVAEYLTSGEDYMNSSLILSSKLLPKYLTWVKGFENKEEIKEEKELIDDALSVLDKFLPCIDFAKFTTSSGLYFVYIDSEEYYSCAGNSSIALWPDIALTGKIIDNTITKLNKKYHFY